MMAGGGLDDIAKGEAQEVAYHRWKHGSHIRLVGLDLVLESAMHSMKVGVLSMKPLPG